MLIEKGADEEVRWLASEKFPIWEAWGADRTVLSDAIPRTSGPLFEPDARRGWACEFTRIGDRTLDHARSPALDDAEKASFYERAVAYYGIAKAPAIETPMKRKAYERQKVALMEASRYFDFKLRREEIPFGGRTIVGYYYEPRQETEIIVPESVLLTGGTDGTKEDLHTMASRVIRAGMACLTVDLPGTGESEWKLEPPNAGGVYARAIKYLAGRGNDPDRIGMIGLGFGGYWSLASAATCPEIKAAVNVGGPIHRAFSHENLKKLPGYYNLALSSAMGYDPGDFERAFGVLSDFSLLRCVDLRRIHCPVLSINGANDPFVPIEDLFIISEEGAVKQDEWVYPGDGHCAPHHIKEWMPRAVEWMANHIGGRERIPRPDLVQL